jgi:hypothetical protein
MLHLRVRLLFIQKNLDFPSRRLLLLAFLFFGIPLAIILVLYHLPDVRSLIK